MLSLVKHVWLIFMKRRPEFHELYEPPSSSYQKELMAFYPEAEQNYPTREGQDHPKGQKPPKIESISRLRTATPKYLGYAYIWVAPTIKYCRATEEAYRVACSP